MVITDGREKLVAAVGVDRLFANFEIEMTPAEALGFVEIAPLAGAPSYQVVARLIEQINRVIPPLDFGPTNPHTGKLHHAFYIGRESNARVIRLSIFRGYFQVDYDFRALREQINACCQEADASLVIETDHNSELCLIRWPVEAEAQS